MKFYSNLVNNFQQSANQINQYVNNLIQQMRKEGSSNAVRGSGDGSGYVAGIGYVTDNGRTYPTNNPNWKPGCNLGCPKK